MQECGTSTGQQTSFIKRVTVRTGGAGHAHSGVVKPEATPKANGSKAPKAIQSKIVRLGR